MKLLYQTHSPFARKVLVFAYEANLADRIEVIHHETSPTQRNEEVIRLNPLGKVPILITGTDETIFDSGVICKYLDKFNQGPKLFPINEADQITAVRLQALSDGLSEIGILARWEAVRRPEELRYQPLLDGLLAKLSASYAYIEEQVDLTGPLSIGQIALATSLSWLEFRDLATFRGNHPKLTEWYDNFSLRTSMQSTSLIGDTHD
ncbi:glutathione S-transferase family protein [Kiloniella sp.]|uniref:glutathione S-transferase family protein n=1 Tax=Kiloniella sp. TaxID=1938587 RepID=UPI003B0200C7